MRLFEKRFKRKGAKAQRTQKLLLFYVQMITIREALIYSVRPELVEGCILQETDFIEFGIHGSTSSPRTEE